MSDMIALEIYVTDEDRRIAKKWIEPYAAGAWADSLIAVECLAEAIAGIRQEERATVGWRPIATAPKDRPIWVYHDHDSDPYIVDHTTGRLTTYGAHCEGLSHKDKPGQCCAVWGGGFFEDQSGEGWGPWCDMPDWWFEEGSDFEMPLAPTHWREKPADPK
jgi:hypothetical protein